MSSHPKTTTRTFLAVALSVAATLTGLAAPSVASAAAPTRPPVAQFATDAAEAEQSPPAPQGSTVIADGLWLSDTDTVERADSPAKYSVEERLPTLGGAPSRSIAGFNEAIRQLVDPDVDTFLLAVADLRSEPASGSDSGSIGSYETIGYTVSTANARIISLLIQVDGYIQGAAHPFHTSRAFTYDLADGRQLDLSDLFNPGAPYLERLADYAAPRLSASLGDAFFPDGAQPRPENYQNWNLTRTGLLFVFDEYQVAPYAAGPQTLEVPYDALADILRGDDRLASVRQ